MKDSFVTPRLKKSGLDEASLLSYRPTSNLTIVSKLLQCLIAQQLIAYHLVPTTQSGNRQGHLTETVTIWVLSDLLFLTQSRWHCCTCPTRPLSCIRSHGTQNSAESTAFHLRRWQRSFRVVSVLNCRSQALYALWWQMFFFHWRRLWCATRTGLRTSPFHYLHCWFGVSYRRTWFVSTPVRWQ